MPRPRILLCALLGLALAPSAPRAQEPDLFDLSIEELGQLRVTSVSRRPEPANRAPAAVYVVTAEDIRRSGVRSIPEALRLAPGVEVVRGGAHSWTITMRGFNLNLSNKLLVLIDGRSVYSPLYAGVFWDVQDTLLEDVERIEVIAGPGGTLWGANAVNGVINIITRSAWDTRGTFARAGAGNAETSAGFRAGGMLSGNIAARSYIKYFDRDAFETRGGDDAADGWHMAQGGFRMDYDPTASSRFTLQGDIYSGKESDLVRGDFTLGTLPETDLPGVIDVAGHNLLWRWERRRGDDSRLQLQAYVDHTERDIPGSFGEERDTLDIDFQHDLLIGGRHHVVWGLGYRLTEDELRNTLFATFEPASRRDDTLSAFIQDEAALLPDRLFLTFGSKWEDNDYSGSEVQPNVRLTWLLGENRMFWAAVSRAVRIPSRLDADLVLTAPVSIPGIDAPVYARVVGNDDFVPEELVAHELGYRFQVGADLSFDIAVFDHDYDKLQANAAGGEPVFVGPPQPYVLLPLVLDNGLEGEVTGGTLVATWQALDNWRLRFQYAQLDVDLRNLPGNLDTNALSVAGNSPEHQAAVFSYLDVSDRLRLYTGIRHVDALPGYDVDSHTSLDLSLAWQPNPRWRTALTVTDLNDARHIEGAQGRVIERRMYLELSWML